LERQVADFAALFCTPNDWHHESFVKYKAPEQLMAKNRKNTQAKQKKRKEKHAKRRVQAKTRRAASASRERESDHAMDYENPLARWDPENDGLLAGATLIATPPIVFARWIARNQQLDVHFDDDIRLSKLTNEELFDRLAAVQIDTNAEQLVAAFAKTYDILQGVDDHLCNGTLFNLPGARGDIAYFATLTLLRRLRPNVPCMEDLDVIVDELAKEDLDDAERFALLQRGMDHLAAVRDTFGPTSRAACLALNPDVESITQGRRFTLDFYVSLDEKTDEELKVLRPIADLLFAYQLEGAQTWPIDSCMHSTWGAIMGIVDRVEAQTMTWTQILNELRAKSPEHALITWIEVLAYGHLGEESGVDVQSVRSKLAKVDAEMETWFELFTYVERSIEPEVADRIRAVFDDLIEVDEDADREGVASGDYIDTTATS
jgi:hypothetical protein